ncbi:MAG: glycosyltransferase family 4 protein [Chloroflexota bacterium]|nr:glycosyltransferase family 4 protein [Chloroflexota bacterium]
MTSRKVDVWIIFLGSDALLLPILTARIIGKKVIMQRPGSALHDFKVSNHSLIKPMEILSKTSLMFSNNILLYSPRLEKEWELEKYHNKILIARRHFLDLTTFEVRKQLHERKSVIGYIGRFKEEKGIMQLIQAIPLVLRERNDLEFSLIGDGHLLTDIESHLDRYESHGKVKITKWMAHEELVSYLNELRLIVLPSYIEGLPNIMLEAMACGTPVLATSVGAIPDVIRDGETGFIMEDNTPQCIASNIIRALHNPDLDQITGNARALVEREFTYESAVERYQNILYSFDPR